MKYRVTKDTRTTIVKIRKFVLRVAVVSSLAKRKCAVKPS